MYWVQPINPSRQQFGEFNTLYKDLRMYLDRFYTYYRISTEQFNYILAQTGHLIYKPNTNWLHIISAEEKLTICIRYLYILNYFCYHLKALSVFTLMHLLSPTQKQYCVKIELSKTLTDVFV